MSNPGDKFPERNLPGSAENWGREIEKRIENAEKLLGATSRSVRNAQRAVSGQSSVIETQIASVIEAKDTAREAQVSADGKNSIWYLPEAPEPPEGVEPEEYFKVGDTWFDTSDDNRIYEWEIEVIPGEEEGGDEIAGSWVPIEFGTGAIADGAIDGEKIAQEVNDAIQNAVSDSSEAKSTAESAMTLAGTKTKVIYSTSAPSGSAETNDVWRRQDGSGNIIGEWRYTGSGWQETQLTNSVISNLDAGKITTGFLNAARLQAGTITAESGILADASVVTAKIADLAVATGKIADLAVTDAKIADLAVTNAKIANATIQSAKIANLDAAKITSGSFEGKSFTGGTFTGSVFRTSASGQRIQFDANGLRAFNAGGVETARISSADGGFKVGEDNYTYTLLRSGYFDVRGGTSAQSSKVNIQSYGDGYYAGIAAEAIWSGGFASLDLDVAGTGPSRESRISTRGGTPLRIGQADARTQMVGDWYHEGDTNWIQLNGWTGGFAHAPGTAVQYRRKGGYVEFKGSLTNSSWSGAFTSFGASMPVGFRPSQTAMYVMPVNSTVSRAVEFRPDGQIRLYGSVASGAWWSFDMVRFPAEG